MVLSDTFSPRLDENRPTLYIAEIDNEGLVMIKSDTKMNVDAAFNSTELLPVEARRLRSEFVGVCFSEHVPQNYSLIQNSTVILDRIEMHSIEISIDYFDPTQECQAQLGFSWKFVSYTQ